MTYTFVAGGTGFVGRQFVTTAADAGRELCVLTRDAAAAAELDQPGVHVVIGDLLTPGPWQAAAAEADAAVYIAGPPTWGRRLTKQRALEYQHGMQAMTEAFLQSLDPDRVRRVVYVAGASYYGDTGEHPATEDQAPRPKGTGPYIAPAIAAAEGHAAAGLPVVTTFPGAVYGPGSWLSQLILEPLHRRKPIYSLRGHDPAISVLHQEDCALALNHLLEHGIPGERYFLSDDQPMTLQTMLALAHELTGIPHRSRPLPKWLCRLAIGPILTDAASGNVVGANEKLKQSGFALRYPTMAGGLPGVLEAWRNRHRDWLVER